MYRLDEEALRELSLRKVTSEDDYQKVLDLRVKGYRGLFSSRDEAKDEFDRAPNCTLLLALDSEDTPVGTMRLLDSRGGDLEIDRYSCRFRTYNFDKKSFFEATRLVTLRTERISKQSVQLALLKGTFDYAINNNFNYLLAWVKKGPDRAYKYLGFSKLPECNFQHPKLGNKNHETFTLDLDNIEPKARKALERALYDFFFLNSYPRLIWY